MTGTALIGVLSGQCLIYTAGADPPPPNYVAPNPSAHPNSPDISSALNRPNAPVLRFKKEDFVPVPEMAPMPLDDPKMERKPPLKVTIPNINEAKQTTQIRNTLAANETDAPKAKSKGFFGRLFSSDENESGNAGKGAKPMDSAESEKLKQLYGSADNTPPLIPTQMQKRGTFTKRENYSVTPQPNATAQAVPVANVAAQDLAPPPKPLSQPMKSAQVYSATVPPTAPTAMPQPTNAQTAQAAPEPVYHSPEPIIKKEVFHLTPDAKMAKNSIIPPVPLNDPRHPLGALSPAAGGEATTPATPTSGPLITLSDIPPEPAATEPKKPAPLPPANMPPANLQSDLPLISLPGSDTPAATAVAAKPAPLPATPTAQLQAPTPPKAPEPVVAQTPPAPVAATVPATVAQIPQTQPLPAATQPATPAIAQVPPEPPKETPPLQAQAPVEKPPEKIPEKAVAATPPAPAKEVPPLQAAAEKPVEKAPEKPVEKSVAARKPTPPPKALSSPLWNEQAKAPAPATVPVTTTAQSNQPQPLPWNAPAAQPAPQPQQAAMPIQPPPVMPPADPSTYGASARPPQPTIATNAIGPARLPANVPSNAVQHWQGPDAVEANAAHQLPTAVLPPATSTPVTQQAQWDEPQYTAPQPAPPPQQAAQQPVSPFTPTPYVPQVAKAPEPVPQPAQQPPAYAQAPVQQPQPAAQPTPTTLTPDQMQAADATEPKRILSEASKEIVRNIHPQPKAERGPAKPVFIEHARDLTHLDQQPQPVSAEGQIGHEAMGVKIEIKAPRINFDYELEKAYNALIAGQSNVAIEIYKRVLENDANNKNALFGLATTYHRAGQLDLARPMYSRLLTVDPGNSDGLNNFLVLLSDEAPEEALVELLKLSERNPQYSALPAQIAVIYQKMGMFDKAGQYMFQAIEMAPENITYRYNFAIMLDKQQKFDEAAKLYRQIIQAYQRGEAVPGNIQKIQQRLTFISSNRPS